MIKQLLVLSAASVLIGGGLITTKAIADQSTLMAQTAPSTEQREEGARQRRGSKFERLTGITDAQKTQLRQIHEASHQQIDAIPTSEQKAQMQAIRQDTKTKMDTVLTDQQRQQLQELRQQKRQDRQQRQS